MFVRRPNAAQHIKVTTSHPLILTKYKIYQRKSKKKHANWKLKQILNSFSHMEVIIQKLVRANPELDIKVTREYYRLAKQHLEENDFLTLMYEFLSSRQLAFRPGGLTYNPRTDRIEFH